MKTNLLKILAASCVPIVLAGCNDNTVVKSQTEQVEISFAWWGNDDRHDYTIEAIDEFERLHPEIKVKCHYSEWSGFQARNNVQMISHTESDVMQINYAWLSQYSPDGSGYYDISTLSEYVDLSAFSEEDLEYGMQNGKLNALPIALNTETMYINKTVYDSYGLDIPKTWDDFFKAGEIMNGEAYPLSMTKKTSWFYAVSYVGQLTGKDFMDGDGNILYDKSDIQMMLEFYCKLINKKVMPQVEYFDKLELASGKYAGVLAWLSDASSYCSGAIDNGFEMIVADYTTIAGNLDNWYAKPATMYAIRKDIEHPKEAAMLLDYLLNSSEMAEYQQIEKGIPLSSSARTYLEENDHLSGIQYDAFTKMSETRDQLEIISPYFENDDLINAFNDSCNEVLFGKNDAAGQAELLYKTFKNYSK